MPYVRSQQRAAVWFVHSLTTVLLCTEVPEGSTPLIKRGWNALEHACAWLITPLDGTRIAPMTSWCYACT